MPSVVESRSLFPWGQLPMEPPCRQAWGATAALRRKGKQEGEEKEGDHLLEGVQLDLRVQPEVRCVDPLVVVGLVILMAPRGRAEEEATLAERLPDPLQEVAPEAPLTLALCARTIFLDSAKGNRRIVRV